MGDRMTNNEDREATAEQKAWDELARLTSGAGPAANWRWSIPANPDRDSDLILAAGLKALADERDALTARRLPVSGDNGELIAKLRNVECYYGGELRDWMRNAAKQAAYILSASQPRETAPSDTPEDIAKAVRLWAERFIPGDRWDPEDMHDLEAALSCVVEASPTAHDRRREAAPSDTDEEALEQATLYGYQAVWDDGEFDADPAKNAWMWERVQIAVKAAVERAARASRPVQVEVTDDMVERAATEMAVLDLPDTHSLEDRVLAREKWHRYAYEAGRVLVAALGGGK